MMAAEQHTVLRGKLRRNEPMARHTSWRVGGPARTYYEPADCDDLVIFLQQLPSNEPLFWLGLGSNLLVRDGGIAGTVVATSGALMDLVQTDALTVHAGAGVACNKVARFMTRRAIVRASSRAVMRMTRLTTGMEVGFMENSSTPSPRSTGI